MNKLAFFLAGFATSALLGIVGVRITSEIQDSKCDTLTFVRKVACEKPIISKAEYASLKADLEIYVKEKESQGTLLTAGVYFRDLENGPTMGVNEYEEFSTASLLKLPTLLTYLSLAEKDPYILSSKITSTGALVEDADQYFPSKERLTPNTAYTIDELLSRLIIYSDNAALSMLNTNLQSVSTRKNVLIEMYKDMGLVPDEVEGDFILSVKRYASIFSSLYNAWHLSPTMSEKALDLLARSAFKDGLVAGIPSDMVVAHKFGERSVPPDEKTPAGTKQLHDCGIVYFPGNPYLLCVMTRGTQYEDLETIISDISRMVYTEVESRRL